jgi:transcriptional regulator of acetoin/glycerol metabolism
MELAFVLAAGGAIGRGEILEAIGRPCALGTASEQQIVISEKAALLQLMERHRWVVVDAARELDVTPKTVYSRLQRAGIKLPKRGSLLPHLPPMIDDALQSGTL